MSVREYYIMGLPSALLSPSSKNKKNSTLKKFLIFSQKKSSSYISGKLNSYVLGNGTFKPKHVKIKKNHPEKISYISGNGTFLL